ncbi:MAG TPA: hypothetical protein VHW60_08430 [Caulobacteraceae bacterium]|jgi:hypothetical protein|nr:hypothetical protein [Caulobacteraceae bacterium]
MFRYLLVAAFSVLWFGEAIAGAQNSAQAPSQTATPPRTDDVPPFLHARGGGAPLALAISGLAQGYARVAAGRRVFAVCWYGGVTPFEVVLTDPSGKGLIDEANLDGNELVKQSKPVELAAGADYRIEVIDAQGSRAIGSFHVEPPASIPATTADAAAAPALALSKADISLSYEAYLRLAPGSGGPETATGRAVASLCHQVE